MDYADDHSGTGCGNWIRAPPERQNQYYPVLLINLPTWHIHMCVLGIHMWAPKNWCFQTVVLEKTLESPLDCREIKPVNPRGSQAWIFIEGTDAEAEVPIIWPPDAKIWLIRKDSDAGKDLGQEKVVTEGEIVGWYHQLNGHEFEQIPWDSEGQGSLAWCSPWGHKEQDMTEQWTTSWHICVCVYICTCVYDVCTYIKKKDWARWQSRWMCTHLLLQELQNYNLLLNNHRQENVGSHQRKTCHIEVQRRSPSKTVGGAKSHLESHPTPARDAQKGSNESLCAPAPETPQRQSQTCLWVFECLLWRHGSAMACCGDRGSACSRPRAHSVWHKPCWRRSPLTPL